MIVSTLDVVEQQAVRLVVALDLVDEHLAKLVARRGCDTCTTRFDWRATGANPVCLRPWPFDRGIPRSARDMMKLLNTPFSTDVTRRASMPSLS